MGFFTHIWIVAIGGGLISGIIILLFTDWIRSRKSSKEHSLKVLTANKQVIDILKPYVADNGLPNTEIVDAIITSTARKVGVQENELFTVQEFCQELICEITGNVYVSADKKREYSELLKNYILATASSSITKETKHKIHELNSCNSKKISVQIGTYLGIITSFVTICLYVYESLEFGANNMVFVPIITIIIVIAVIVAGILLTFPAIKRVFRAIKEYDEFK